MVKIVMIWFLSLRSGGGTCCRAGKVTKRLRLWHLTFWAVVEIVFISTQRVMRRGGGTKSCCIGSFNCLPTWRHVPFTTTLVTVTLKCRIGWHFGYISHFSNDYHFYHYFQFSLYINCIFHFSSVRFQQ